MFSNSLPVWKEAPFIRLIIPFISGIMIEWYIGLQLWIYVGIIPICLLLILLFSFLNSFARFSHYWAGGTLINLLFLCLGGAITYYKDIRHNKNSITSIMDKSNNIFVVTLTEPLSEKNNSFKATAVVNQLLTADSIKATKGNIIIYFQKDSSVKKLTYNSHLIFKNKLQLIKNSGNPGAFDYQRYCAFQQIFYQVNLKPADYILLPATHDHLFTGFLFSIRSKIVAILQTYLSGKKEAGLAEALLIGYKDDLDKNLVQAYSNTGVVHIIAISGLHVGLIYWLLALMLKPVKFKGSMRWVNALLIICGLWLFSLLTGGSPSVCRSALMFSFIVIGENSNRKTNIYNSLFASAFFLLCYNPYWLWDAGFQLSYIAVLSIVIFMKPVYNLFYIKNKLLDHLWKMAAISIAAQILTTPVSIYLFHQFPNYFLVANMVAVPLSSVIVLCELALYTVNFIPTVAKTLGALTTWLIKLMNDFIDYINKMPFATTTQLQLSLSHVIIIYLLIVAVSIWILQKSKLALILSLFLCCCLCMLESYFLARSFNQKILIVYNIAHHQAIDLIRGHNCLLLADSAIFNEPSAQNFTLKPSRMELNIKKVSQLYLDANMITQVDAGNKNIFIINGQVMVQPGSPRYPADIIILSGSSDISISELQRLTGCMKIIFDSSCPAWKIKRWETGCINAGIPFYSVVENGAFILNLN
jgi:competence protein ComEC